MSRSLFRRSGVSSRRRQAARLRQSGSQPLGFETLEFRRLLAGDLVGKVMEDVNANGIDDPGDDGLPGWTVFLDTNLNGTYQAGEPFRVTDADGQYEFLGLAAGNYRIREIPQAGWTPTSPIFVNATVIDDDETKVEFLNHFGSVTPVGSVSGLVWSDLNFNGIRDYDSELENFVDPILAGWTVFLDADDNGILNPGETSTTTDANGVYTFAGLTPGDYHVAEVLPADWEPTTGFQSSYLTTVVAFEGAVVDFANYQRLPTSVSGVVWNDLNGDGSQAGESGLGGWQVYLDLDNSGSLDAGEPSTTTDSAGAYQIVIDMPGTYTVRDVRPNGWNPTYPSTGSFTLSFANGTILSGMNFGNHARSDAVISGRVYKDANHNGVRDAGEPGLSGITVYLDANNNGALDAGEASMVTAVDQFFTPAVDETGTYSFTHLTHGTYRVREIVPVEQSATPSTESLKTIVLAPGEQRIDVNMGNQYRPNEIHGVLYYDANRNHIRDAGEMGIGGVTVYIDSNRNNSYDAGEPTTVTAASGAYSFTGLTPGAYVVRVLVPPGQTQTYPETTDGILWPTGVSNPASGNVTPTSITTSLAEGQHYSQTVSLTLPGSGGVTNMVDVFLLFDDTGSFTANSPIVRAAFPQIIADLQASLPGLDLGFGVGRFEEYGNFASEYATGRPFVLNHAIVPASNPAMTTAIQAALDRVAPGYGGDTPETLIEALYQTVTGLGFDGNNNGSALDSGPAGPAATQVNPGNSGDVPSFASYTTDAANNVLPAVGNVGGAGFRPGALPVILAATDTGFAYQPKGETSITGLNGLTLPLSALTQASRPTTPFNYGAGIQETITGLNALGALVIGLGTNPQPSLDPRADLEAIAKLTGAVNNSTATITNGTPDPIDPGDPFYFQISTGFAGTVSSGVVNAIQNAATNVAMNITVRASDPRVHIINHTGTINGVGAGQTATFDIEFVGDGRPHRFDLQFIREGTSVVLGSIPVVLGTPIPGNGYGYEDLDDGEIEDHADFGDDDDDLTAVINGPTTGYRGESLTFSIGATSAGIDPGHNVTYAIDWNGDGTVDQSVVGPVSGITVSHSFFASGPNQIKLTATEGYDTSPITTRTVNITDYALRPNADNPALMDLVWGGSDGDDSVVFTQTGPSAVSVQKLLDNGVVMNVTEPVSGVTGRVIAYGNPGNDSLDGSGLSTMSATVDGGAGNNTLRGGNGGDILIGGTDGAEGGGHHDGSNVIIAGNGTNTIYGNAPVGKKDQIGGDNLIIGGTGADTIYGNYGINNQPLADGGEGGHNILIGGQGADSLYTTQSADGGEGAHGSIAIAGTTTYGNTPAGVAALQSILAEWSSSHTLAVKQAYLQGTGGPGGLNGANYLTAGGTVLSDAAVDTIFGDTHGSAHWFFFRLSDDLLSRDKPGDIKTPTP